MPKVRRVGFTILELLIGVVVLAIITSIAVAGYQGYRNRSAMLVDETNEKVLVAAVKLYAYDNNALPGSLSQLRPRDLQRAFALVTEGKHPYTFLAYLQEWVGVDTAEAEVLPPKYYNNNPKVLACPMDPSPPSYELASGWTSRPLKDLLDTANAGQILITEVSDVPHQVDMTVSGEPKRIKKNKGGGSKGKGGEGPSGRGKGLE